MSSAEEMTRELADIQKRLIDLPSDAFSERYELQKRQDHLRDTLRANPEAMFADRPNEDLLAELAALRRQRDAIDRTRIDLVTQAGSGGPGSGEMGNLGAYAINKGIQDAHGLPAIQSRIGIIKNVLDERGVDIPPAD